MKAHKIFSVWEYLLSALFLMAFVLTLYYKYKDPANKGLLYLKTNQLEKAEEVFKKAVKNNPLNFVSQLNLAFTYDRLKQPDQALQNYSMLAQATGGELSFYSYFNQAELFGRLKDLDPALKNYQKSLEFDRHRETIKKNIEWLFKNQDSDSSKDSQKGDSDQKQESQEGESSQEEQAQKGESSQEDKEGQNSQEEESKEGESSNSDQEGESSQDTASDSQESSSKKEYSDKMGLTTREEQAILEEIEGQENRVRSQFYKGKKVFGNKTEKDW